MVYTFQSSHSEMFLLANLYSGQRLMYQSLQILSTKCQIDIIDSNDMITSIYTAVHNNIAHWGTLAGETLLTHHCEIYFGWKIQENEKMLLFIQRNHPFFSKRNLMNHPKAKISYY